MHKTMRTAALLLAVFVRPAAAADSYTIDPRHTFPGFKINHLGFSFQRGRFDRTTGKITLDPDAGSGSLHIVVDTASISTGLDELEKHLRSEDFLDVARYPQMVFKSDQFRFSDKKPVAVDGLLTLHGVTRPVQLNIDHFYCGLNPIALKSVCGANATGTIKRSDFGVDKYVPMLADEVELVIQVEAIKD